MGVYYFLLLNFYHYLIHTVWQEVDKFNKLATPVNYVDEKI